MNNEQSILILGSKGFIGTHVMHYFSGRKGYKVYACDVMVDYAADNYFQLDPVNADYQELFEQLKPGICINCSGAASVPDSLAHPYRDYMLNTVNVFKMLEAIRKHQPSCHFINLSSAAVYGNPTVLPVTEDHLCNPVSAYGSHKLQAEMICKEFFQYFGIKSCFLRIFSAFGEGLQKQLFWDLAHKARSDNTIHLFGTGKESRDFIYVKDIARIIELIMQKASFTAECYNVANGVEITVQEAAELFLNLTGKDNKLAFDGVVRPGDPANWKADITKVTALGYVPQYTFDKGLKKYVEWLQERKLA